MAPTRKAASASSPLAELPPLDPDRTLDLVMQLMAIPGKSGEEGEVAEFVRAKLLDAGVPADALQTDTAHQRTQLAGQIGNLILKLPGSRRSPRRMLTAHLDTVPLCIGSRPTRNGQFVRSADPTTALGADNRAGVAVLLATAIHLVQHQLPHPPLTFCWFVQEEIGLHGARHVTRSLLGKPRLAYNWDGGSPAKLTVGATGGYRMQIDVQGIASHAGGAPEMGVSAIAIASLAIADLQRGGWHGDVRQGRKRGTSNIGMIEGGHATNVVTDHVRLKAEARSHDPKFRQRIVNEIEKCFQRAVREVKNEVGERGRVTFDGRLDYEAFRLTDDEPCVTSAEAAVRAVGREPMRAISNGGLDANWLNAHGIPAVTLGCGQINQHMTSEALDVPDYLDACQIALRLATATETAV